MHEYVYKTILSRVPKKMNCKYRKDGDHYLAIDYSYGGLLIALNQTASDVFEHCDGKNTISDILNISFEKYSDVDQEVIRYDVAKCIRDLEVMNLISVVG